MFQSTTLGCGRCGNGLVAFVLAADGGRVVLFCMNCGTWYPSADHDEQGELLDGTTPEGPEWVLPGSDCSVRFPPARWATAEEVREFGWGSYLDVHALPPTWSPEDQPWWPERVWGIV